MPVRWILFATLFAIGIDNDIIAAILPDIAGDLGVTIAVVGLLASAYAVPNALLSLAALAAIVLPGKAEVTTVDAMEPASP